jgi:hypothetical protein
MVPLYQNLPLGLVVLDLGAKHEGLGRSVPKINQQSG